VTTHIVIRTATFSVTALLITHASLHAQKRWDAPSIVSGNCSGCHGIDGNAELPYFPKLAGLNSTYAQKKMAEFKESPSPHSDDLYGWMVNRFGDRKSTENVTPDERINMVGIAHAVKPEAMKEAVGWYAKQCPTPGRGGDNALIQQGRELYAKGVPDQQILACMSCHGKQAEGQTSTPRLAGQNTEYIQAQLDKFRKGDRKHAPEMTMVAKELSPEQARAVAAYLNTR